MMNYFTKEWYRFMVSLVPQSDLHEIKDFNRYNDRAQLRIAINDIVMKLYEERRQQDKVNRPKILRFDEETLHDREILEAGKDANNCIIKMSIPSKCDSSIQTLKLVDAKCWAATDAPYPFEQAKNSNQLYWMHHELYYTDGLYELHILATCFNSEKMSVEPYRYSFTCRDIIEEYSEN